MDSKLIARFKNVISTKNINDYIKKGEEFYEQFCSEIIEYSKNDNIETIKNICAEISKIDTGFHYLSSYFNNSNTDELILVKGLLSIVLDILHTKSKNIFMKLGDNSQLTRELIHSYNCLNTLCQNLIYIDLINLKQGLEKIKLTLTDIDTISIINLLNNLPLNNSSCTAQSLDHYSLQSYILNTAEQVSYSSKLRIFIPLLFLIERTIPLNPLDILSGFKKYMHLTDEPVKEDNKMESLSSLIEFYTRLCNKSRIEGLLSLEDDLEGMESNSILVRGIQLIVDGTDPDIVKDIISNRIDSESNLLKTENMIIIEGVLSVQAGDNPRIVLERLKAVCTDIPELSALISRFVEFSEKARREGIIALEDDIDELDNPLLCAGMKMMLNGIHPLLIKSILEILSEIIFNYKHLVNHICIEGALGILQGKSPENLSILLKSKIPHFTDKENLTNNKGIASIFENAFKRYSEDEAKDELAIFIIEFIRPIASITGYAAFLDSIFNTLFNTKNSTKKKNKIRDELNNIFTTAVQNNELKLLDFLKLDEYFCSMREQLAQITENDKKITKQAEIFSDKMNKERNKSSDILNKCYAEKKLTLKTLGYTAKPDRIASYLSELGDIYIEQNRQYKQLLSDNITKTAEKINKLTLQFFNFSPELEQNEEQDFLLRMITNLLFDVEDMFANIKNIFKDSPMLDKIIDDVFPFSSIKSCPDNVIKSIIGQINREELIYAIKSSEDYIKEIFFNNMENDEKNKIIEELEYTGSFKTEDVEKAQKKIRILALQHKDVITSIKFSREFRRNMPQFGMFC